MPIVPYGTVIFCDDIRDEVGGKVSHMGVYQRHLYVHGDFPFSLPKFGMVLTYADDIDEAPEEVEFQIRLPGDDSEPSIKGLAKRGPETAKEPLPDGTMPGRVIFTANLLLAPLVLKQEGPIRVVALRNGEEIKMGTLFVQKAKSTN
jgi:hypothetical protein